jgi:pyruvate dehydrogenase E2 component (dihydrolipoamide acetyltransferase)
MAGAIEVRVPNIGDFKDVPVIEVLVKPGDVVKAEDPLITVESEKASMEVPSPSAGKVESVSVKVGDKISEGSAILTLATDGASAPANGKKPEPAPAVAEQTPAPAAAEQTPAPAAAEQTPAPAAAEQTPAPAPSAPPQPKPTQPAPPASSQTFQVTVPDIGDFNDVPVIEVLVKPGDTVQKETPLVTLESEKASMEVPSPSAGVVKAVQIKVGDKVSKGANVLTLETADAPPVTLSGASEASAVEGRAGTPKSNVSSAPSTSAPLHGASAQGDNGEASPQTPSATSGVVHASPSIRRFARELGVDLAKVKGTGPNGRIVRDDVQSFVKRALAEPRAASGAMPFNLPPWPKLDFAQFGPTERIALSRIKKISGPALARNWVMIPHVTNHEDADITDLEQFRQQLNLEYPQVKVTMLAFLIKAVVAALQRFPDLNSSLDGDDLILKKYYNIGFAADTPNGLLVPVIKNADEKGLLIVARETRELAAKARDGKLALAEMQGASFTISSLGGIGGTGFTPIINAPEVAILGVSRSSTRPVWNGTEFLPRLILPLSLSYDHRVVDGAQAARFNDFLAGVLGDMRRAML